MILHKKHQYWLPVKEYYSFPPRLCEFDGTRYRCPGCGARNREQQQLDHECLGGEPEYPRINPIRWRSNQRWHPRAKYNPELLNQ